MPDVIIGSQTVAEFPVPKDKVVLLDIDGTLIGTGYEITDPAVHPAIREAREAGWTVGLSSNTSHDSMMERAEELGIGDGPIISEKGARAKFGPVDVEPIPGIAQYFADAQKSVGEHFTEEGFVVWTGNRAEALKMQLGEPGDRVLIISDRRRYTMGLYFRSVNMMGQMVLDDELTRETACQVEELLPPFEDLRFSVYPDYGSLSINRMGINKRVGTKALMSAMGWREIAMVGNTKDDYLGNDIAQHYAVGDADQGYKALADYVAATPTATGVAEILRKLVMNS